MKSRASSNARGSVIPVPASDATRAAEIELVRLLARQAAAEHVAALRTARDAV